MSNSPDVVKSVAEATKAVAETAGKALDVVRDFGAFLDKVVGNAAAEGGGILADQVKYWRKMQLLAFEEKFNAACAARGLSPENLKPLSLGKTVQMLEAASLEDEDEVQSLWAELMANAVDPNSNIALKKMYITLLKDLGPAEAVLLDLIGQFRPYRRLEAMPMEAISQKIKDTEDHFLRLVEERWRKFSKADQDAAINNLRRLGCIAPTFAAFPTSMQALIKQVHVEGRSRPQEVTQINPRQLERLINWLIKSIAVAGGAANQPVPDELEYRTPVGSRLGKIKIPELNLVLTTVGTDLVRACSMPAKRTTDGS